MNLEQATQNYLKAVEEHSKKLRSYRKALMGFEPEAPELHTGTRYLAREYSAFWENARTFLLLHLKDGTGALRPLDLVGIVDLLRLATAYNADGWRLLNQLEVLHHEYDKELEDEQKKHSLSNIETVGMLATDLAWTVRKTFQDLSQTFVERPNEVDDPSVVRQQLTELTTKVFDLESEIRELKRRAAREPRPYTIADLAATSCRHKQTVHHHVRQLRNSKEIEPRKGARGGFRFTRAERDIILERMEVETSLR